MAPAQGIMIQEITKDRKIWYQTVLLVEEKNTLHGIQTVKSVKRGRKKPRQNWPARYPVRPRVEQNRAYTSTPVNLDSDGYQIVTHKRKALGELAEAIFNMSATKTKPGMQGRPPLTAKLTEKELRQQIIQFSSPMTKFTGASITPEQAFGLVLETVRESADANIKTTPSSL